VAVQFEDSRDLVVLLHRLWPARHFCRGRVLGSDVIPTRYPWYTCCNLARPMRSSLRLCLAVFLFSCGGGSSGRPFDALADKAVDQSNDRSIVDDRPPTDRLDGREVSATEVGGSVSCYGGSSCTANETRGLDCQGNQGSNAGAGGFTAVHCSCASGRFSCRVNWEGADARVTEVPCPVNAQGTLCENSCAHCLVPSEGGPMRHCFCSKDKQWICE
jgi:hypothetical protein